MLSVRLCSSIWQGPSFSLGQDFTCNLWLSFHPLLFATLSSLNPFVYCRGLEELAHLLTVPYIHFSASPGNVSKFLLYGLARLPLFFFFFPHWSSLIAFLLNQMSILITLLGFLSIVMNPSLKTCEFPWAPSLFRALVLPPTSSLNNLRSSLLYSATSFLTRLWISSSTVSWSLQPTLPLIATYPTSSSFLVNSISNSSCPSYTWAKKLFSSTNLLDCLCLPPCCHSSSCEGHYSSPWDSESVIHRLLHG